MEFLKNNKILVTFLLIAILIIPSLFATNKSKDFIEYLNKKFNADYYEIVQKIEKDNEEYKVKQEGLFKQLTSLSIDKRRLQIDKFKLKKELDRINGDIENLNNTSIILTGDKSEVSKILNNLGYTNSLLECK